MVSSKNIWNFDPTSIGGCSLWLDGADPNTMFSDEAGTVQSAIGDSVALWRNKSVSGGNIFSTINVPTGAFTGTAGSVTLPLSSTTGIFQGTMVTIAGVVSTGGLTTLNGTYTVTAVAGNNITFPNRTTTNSVTTAGTLTIDNNNAIGGIISATSIVATGAVGSTGTISYSVNIFASNTIGLGMLVGNSVTTTGISPAAFNVTNAVISSITEVTAGVLYTIVVNATGATGTATSGGLMTFTNTKFPTRTASNLSFSGSQYLALPNPSLLPRGATNTTRFVVCRTNNTTTRQTIFNNGSNAGGGGHFLQFNLGGSSPAPSNSYFLTNAFPAPTSGIQPISQLHMITGQFNNLIQAGWHNGTPYPSNNNGDAQRLLLSLVNVGSAFSLIGGDIIAPVSPFTANSRYLDGNISEILVYDSALSNTDRQNIEGYLSWKWNLQGTLPTTHPYAPRISSLSSIVPKNYAGLVLWLDAADTSTIQNAGTSAMTWTDKSSRGVSATVTGSGGFFPTNASITVNGASVNTVSMPTSTAGTSLIYSFPPWGSVGNSNPGQGTSFWVSSAVSGTGTPGFNNNQSFGIYSGGFSNAASGLQATVGTGYISLGMYAATTTASSTTLTVTTTGGGLANQYTIGGLLKSTFATLVTNTGGTQTASFTSGSNTMTTAAINNSIVPGMTVTAPYISGSSATVTAIGGSDNQTITLSANATSNQPNVTNYVLSSTVASTIPSGTYVTAVSGSYTAPTGTFTLTLSQPISILTANTPLIIAANAAQTNNDMSIKLTPAFNPFTSGSFLTTLAVTGSGGSASLSVNGGTPVSTPTPIGVTANGVTPAFTFSNAATSSISIFEIIHFNTFLSTTQKQQIEGYLAYKWGLEASLPAGHPYGTAFVPYNPVYRRPFSRNFVPTDIPNCVMWFDGADLTSMFTDVAGATGATGTGSVIRHWRDKSGSGNNLTNAATGPTLTTSANPRGFDMVFNGTSSFLSKTDVVNNSNTYTKFLVFNRNSTTTPGYKRIFAYGTVSDQAPNDPTGFHIQEGTDVNRTVYILNKSVAGLSFTIATDTYYVATIVAGPTSISLFLNGGLTPTGTLTTVNTNFNAPIFRLGTNVIVGNNGYWGGVINEVISYNRQLGVAEYREVEGYLAWKWGLRNSLPTAHPFFRYPTPYTTPIQPELQLYKPTFDPSDLSPSLWLDGSDTSTYATTNNRITSWVSKGTQSVTLAPPNIPYVVEIVGATNIPTGATGTSFTMNKTAVGIGTLSGITVTVGGTAIPNCTLVGGSRSLVTGSSVTVTNGASVTAFRHSITIPTSTTTSGGTATNSFTLSSAPTGSTGTISGVQAYIAGVPVPNCTFTRGSTGFTTGANITIANGADVVVQPGPLVNTATRGIGLDLPYTDFSSGGTFKLTAATNAAYSATAITLTASRVALDGTSIEISSSPSVTLTVNQQIVFGGTGTVIPTGISAGTTYFIRSVSTLAATNINFPTNYITLGATAGGAPISTLTPGTLSGVTATAGAYLFTFTTSIPHRIPSGAPVTLVLDSHTSTATANATGKFFGNIASVPSTTQFTIQLTSATVGAGTGTSQRLVGNVQYGNNSIVRGSLGTDGITLELETAAPHNLQTGFVVQPYFFGPSLPSQWMPYNSIAVRSGTTTCSGTIAGTTLTITSGTPPGIGAPITGTGVTAGTCVSGVITAGSQYILNVSHTISSTTTFTSTYASTPITFVGGTTGTSLTVTSGTTPSPGMMISGSGISAGTYIISGSSSPFTLSQSGVAPAGSTLFGTNYSFEMTSPSGHWPPFPTNLNNSYTFAVTGYNGTTISLNAISQTVTPEGGIIVFVAPVGSIPAGAYYAATVSGLNSNISVSASRNLTPLLDTGGIAAKDTISIPISVYAAFANYRFCSFGSSVLNSSFNNNANGRIIGIDNSTRTLWLGGFTINAPTAGIVNMSTIQNPGLQRTGSGSFAQYYVYGTYPITRLTDTTFTISLTGYFNDALQRNGNLSPQSLGSVTYSGPMANYGFTDFRYGGNAIGEFSFTNANITTTQAVLSYPANGYLLEASGTNLRNSFSTQTTTVLMVTHVSTFPQRTPGQSGINSAVISTAVAAEGVGGADTTSGGRDFALRPAGTAQNQQIVFSHNDGHSSIFRPGLIDTTSGYRIFSIVFNGTAAAVGDVPANSKCAGIHGQRYDGTGSFAQNLSFQTAIASITSATSIFPLVMRLGGDTCTYGFGINPQMFCDAGIAEVMVFNTELTLEQRQIVEGFLSQKYACQYILANGSATVGTGTFIHPYRTSPAIISPSLDLTRLYAQGLAAWFDAANSSTIGFASSNNVNSWATAGGNLALTLIPNGTNYPTLVQAAQNGLPGVRFTSSGTPLGTSSIYGINQFSTVSANNEFTIITVYKQPTFTSGQTISNIIGSSNDPRLAAYTNQFSYRNTTTEQTKDYTANVNGQTYISVYYRRRNTLLVRDNGLADAGAAPADGTNLSIPTSIGSIFGVTLGAYAVTSPTTTPFAGDIYEHIIFRYALTNQAIFQIEGYLAWKWGLQTALPTTHPYYKVRP